jgi:acyl carrier protein
VTETTGPAETAAAVVRAAVRDVLDTDTDLGLDTVLADQGWDSSLALEALARVEAALAVTLDLRRFIRVRTVADLVDLVSAARSEPGRPGVKRSVKRG